LAVIWAHKIAAFTRPEPTGSWDESFSTGPIAHHKHDPDITVTLVLRAPIAQPGDKPILTEEQGVCTSSVMSVRKNL